MSPSASKNIVLTLQKGLNFTLQFISMPCLQPEGRGKRGVCGGGGGWAAKHTRWKTSLPPLVVMNNFKWPQDGREEFMNRKKGLTIWTGPFQIHTDVGEKEFIYTAVSGSKHGCPCPL